LELVDRELHKIKRSRKLPGGVVIAGGTAKLPGLEAFTRDRLQLAARVGKLEPISGLVDAVEDVSYSTVVGLMLLDMFLPAEQEFSGVSRAGEAMGMIEGLVRRLKRN